VVEKIVFYCESDTFGGHEKMALTAHTAILQRYNSISIFWLINSENQGLKNALEIAGLNYMTLPNMKVLSLWRNPLCGIWRICNTSAVLKQMSPDLVMVIQGSILISFCGLISAWVGRIRYCSYIPMVFSISNVRKYRYPALADYLWSILYRAASSYITIDTEQALRLRQNNRRALVAVVDNYVPKCEPPRNKHDAKATLRIPANKKVLTIIGRIVFPHKCQDWIFRELKDDPFLADKFVLFVGNGADAPTLQAILTPDIQDRFGIIGWKNDLCDVYSSTDVLLIPSKIEGVPLVMLEALSYGIPVVGTDQDGMRSWLPAQWRFTWGDRNGFKSSVEHALSVTSQDVWKNITERLSIVHDENRFAAQFSKALRSYCRD
jgi:glycosyltransferase involved in cell wall biosynthesis